MNRIVLFVLILLLFVVAATFAWWALTLPGAVTIPWGEQEISIQSGLAAFLMLVLGGVIAFCWWIVSGLFILPGKIGKSRQVSRTRKANSALTEGLLAAEAGDASTALKLARKAAKHAEDERLQLLLEARAAEAADDWAGAERAWKLTVLCREVT